MVCDNALLRIRGLYSCVTCIVWMCSAFVALLLIVSFQCLHCFPLGGLSENRIITCREF